MSRLSIVGRTLGPTRRAALGSALAAGFGLVATSVQAATQADVTAKARKALLALYANQPRATRYGKAAKAILVFPDIVKAGAMVGGQTGVGVMLVDDKPSGFYRIASGSFGLQLGAQRFGYALFFMSDSALSYLTKSKGWSVGTGPSVVMLDKGFAKSATTTTLTQDVYALAFDQKGLMAGTGLEGSKIIPATLDP